MTAMGADRAGCHTRGQRRARADSGRSPGPLLHSLDFGARLDDGEEFRGILFRTDFYVAEAIGGWDLLPCMAVAWMPTPIIEVTGETFGMDRLRPTRAIKC
jgi:hypothetical protein